MYLHCTAKKIYEDLTAFLDPFLLQQEGILTMTYNNARRPSNSVRSFFNSVPVRNIETA